MGRPVLGSLGGRESASMAFEQNAAADFAAMVTVITIRVWLAILGFDVGLLGFKTDSTFAGH